MPGVGYESFKEDVTRTLRPYGLEESLAFPPRNLSLCRLRGTHVYQQPILDILTNATGRRQPCASVLALMAAPRRRCFNHPRPAKACTASTVEVFVHHVGTLHRVAGCSRGVWSAG